eukprot:2971225-Prymnesium_polylepis.4
MDTPSVRPRCKVLVHPPQSGSSDGSYWMYTTGVQGDVTGGKGGMQQLRRVDAHSVQLGRCCFQHLANRPHERFHVSPAVILNPGNHAGHALA